jgi:hypothetical protein
MIVECTIYKNDNNKLILKRTKRRLSKQKWSEMKHQGAIIPYGSVWTPTPVSNWPVSITGPSLALFEGEELVVYYDKEGAR